MTRFAAFVAAAFVAATPAQAHAPALRLHHCTVQLLTARCGTLTVPEDRARPKGRTIGLHVVVLPAYVKAAKDAVTYLAGGPGVAATSEAASLSNQWMRLREGHDILLVDQRGTGKSGAYSCPNPTGALTAPAKLSAYTAACLKAFGGDYRQYGSRMAAADLDAVRAALGYATLDVVGGSYGATLAQVYAKLYPSSVRTLTLMGASALDVPFFARYARNAQSSLDRWARLCDAQAACRKAYPNWERRFGELVRAWDAQPVEVKKGVRMSGVQLASVVHRMLLDSGEATSIPLVVTHAAQGDYAPLLRQGAGDIGVTTQVMYWSIWCNEPWAGLDARGPWGTMFDSYTTAFVGTLRRGCTFMPERAEPASAWTFPSSGRVPLLVFAGGTDPQDPISNLPELTRNFRDSRAVVLPYIGHSFGIGGCVDEIMTNFVARATTKKLVSDQCNAYLRTPSFPVTG
ncbi:MAG: alpha/beta fold hydrolase [Actinomycetota bacterium]